MNDEELREMLALVALDALDPDELRAIDAAIAGRPDLRAELDELRSVVALLVDPDEAPPSPALKDSILAQIAAMDVPATSGGRDTAGPQMNGPGASIAGGAPPATSPGASDAAPPVPPVPLPRRRAALLAVAAAVVAVAVGAAAWIASDSSPDTADRVEAVLELPDVQALELHGAMDGVRILHSPSSTAAVLMADGMPDPGADRHYQLWFHHDEIVVPANVFRPDDDGHVEVLLEDFAPAGAVITVTVEPTGGSDQPTGGTLVSSA